MDSESRCSSSATICATARRMGDEGRAVLAILTPVVGSA